MARGRGYIGVARSFARECACSRTGGCTLDCGGLCNALVGASLPLARFVFGRRTAGVAAGGSAQSNARRRIQAYHVAVRAEFLHR